jgi:integrase
MATIYKRGGKWRAQIRRNGQPIQSRDFPSKSDAKRWASTIEGRIDAGAADQPAVTTTTAEPEPAKVKMKLSKALERYQREITPTKRGAKQERNRIKAWLRDPLADKSLSEIRLPQLAEWRDKRLAAGRAPSTIRNALTIISQVYDVAASEWGMEGLANPVARLRLPKNRPGRDRRLEEGEEPALLEAAGGICPNLRAAIVISLETSMRKGELLAVGSRDIRGTIAVLRTSKNGRPRAVALSTRAQTAFADWFKGERPIPITLDKRWRRATKLAKIEGLRWHDLRHEAVSRLFEKGLTTKEVMGMSGHRTYAMLGALYASPAIQLGGQAWMKKP